MCRTIAQGGRRCSGSNSAVAAAGSSPPRTRAQQVADQHLTGVLARRDQHIERGGDASAYDQPIAEANQLVAAATREAHARV